MKKVFCILSILTIMSPAMADITPTTKVVTTSYVQGAYDALETAKQDKISVSAGTGAIVTGVALNADGKTVDVTKSYEVTVPVNSSNSSTRANIWVE